MNPDNTAAHIIDTIDLSNSTDVCDCHDAGVLPVDVETSSARFLARLADGFTILGWITEGDEE